MIIRKRQLINIRSIFRSGTRREGRLLAALLSVLCGLTACTDWVYDDRSGCDSGVYLVFRYDYNLQRADMFADHVGGVTVYVFDADGRYITRQSEANTAVHAPLKDKGYRMHLDLPAGEYLFLAVAMQRDVDATQQAGSGRARFLLTEPGNDGRMEDFGVMLEHAADGTVTHGGIPLDTLWMGRTKIPLRTCDLRAVSDTIDLMRHTKHISVVLRDLDNEEGTDVSDYDFRIDDRNLRLRYDDSVDETEAAVYTPYATWNTDDRPLTEKEGAGIGRMAHADFMTSRLLWHERAVDDATLTVTHRETGNEAIRVNLPDLLSRLRTSDERYVYTEQEFLDRAYDYRLTFFLKGGRWVEVQLEISVLSWSIRMQNVDI